MQEPRSNVPNKAGPLEGFRILDLTSVVMGPFATQILGDYGADVISVEPVEGGTNRGMGSGVHAEFSGIALNLLRNKRSVSLNLKDPHAHAAMLKIIRTCDAVVTNMRPEALKRLSLEFDDIKAIRSDIIYCQAQGFRSGTERANDPAYDDIIQAECGIADAARQIDGCPRLVPTIMADKVCGMAIATALIAALLHKVQTGEGQRIEVPMADVMKAFVLVEHGAGAISDPESDAGYSRVLSPERGPQRTADGWINILPYSAAAYDALFRIGGRQDLVGDNRTRGRNLLVHAGFLYGEIRKIILTRTTAEWLAICTSEGIPFGRVASLNQLVSELPVEHHPVAGLYKHIPQPISFSGRQRTLLPAPRVGQDTRRTLEEVGVTSVEIADMFARGVARGASDTSESIGVDRDNIVS